MTPYRFEVGEAGSAAMRIQEGVMKATAGGGEDGGPLKRLADIGLDILEQLMVLVRLAGGTAPTPRSAGGT